MEAAPIARVVFVVRVTVSDKRDQGCPNSTIPLSSRPWVLLAWSGKEGMVALREAILLWLYSGAPRALPEERGLLTLPGVGNAIGFTQGEGLLSQSKNEPKHSLLSRQTNDRAFFMELSATQSLDIAHRGLFLSATFCLGPRISTLTWKVPKWQNRGLFCSWGAVVPR